MSHRKPVRRFAWWKLFLIAALTMVAAGILLAVAGGLLITHQ